VWNNMLTIVFDPARFGTQTLFEQSTQDFVDWVKSARLADGHDEIMMPGDPERKSRKARVNAVPIDEGTIAEMDSAAASVATRTGNGLGALSALMLGI
jgi:hydroxycarboxylate dehydrogenase B